MIRNKDVIVNVEIKDTNRMAVKCEPVSESYLYAFQLYRGEQMVDRVLYSEQNETVFWLSQSAEYIVRACIKDGDRSVANTSAPISFEHPAISMPVVEEKKPSLFYKVWFILQEIITNFAMLCRIAKYDYKLLNKDSYLGKLWSLFTPLLQIGTYWLVFGMGIRGGGSVDGHPFLLWMLCGLVPWFFINHSITKGATSIYGKVKTVTKMKFPISTVPIGTIVTGWMEHVMVLAILLVALICHGYFPTFYYLNLIYYMAYNFIFLCSLALITSVFTMLARDFERLLSSIVRLIFYLTPILWSMDRMPEIYQKVLEFNPVLYVVAGFRESILYQVNFWEKPDKIVIFWTLNLILFVIGCDLQYKYRKKFSDLA